MDQTRPVTGSARTLFCPQCGYNLTGLPESRCPECGREFSMRELETWADCGPRPISWCGVCVRMLPPALVVWVVSFLVWLAPPFVLVIPLLYATAGVWAIANAVKLARRLAVSRAIRKGGLRSGRHDRRYILLWSVVLFAVQAIVIYVPALLIIAPPWHDMMEV